MHNDDDEVTVGYASSRNISFHGDGDFLGVTWGEWRKMSQKERDARLDEYVWDLVDVWIEDDE